MIIGAAFAAIDAPTYGAQSDWTTAPTDPTDALADEAYVGTYQNDFYGDVEIAAGGDGLVLRLGPKPLEFPLTHFDRDTFTWQPIGENAYGLSGLTFTIEGADPGQRLQRSISGQRRRRRPDPQAGRLI